MAFQPAGSPSTNIVRSFVSRERNRREQVSKALRIAGDRSFILSTTQMPVYAHCSQQQDDDAATKRLATVTF